MAWFAGFVQLTLFGNICKSLFLLMLHSFGRFLGWIYKIWMALYFAVSLTLLYPLFRLFLSKEAWFPKCFKLLRFWAWSISVAGGYWLNILHEDRASEQGPVVYCSNHHSYLDIVMMYRVLDQYFVFLGKSEIENWPLFNIFFTKGMNILVDRKSRSGAARAYVRSKEEIDKGHALAIFPEATIPESAPKLIRFKDGAFKLAVEKQIPIVPITYLDNWRLLSIGKKNPDRSGPGRCRVIVHKAIPTVGMTEDDVPKLRQQVFDLLAKTLSDHGRSQE